MHILVATATAGAGHLQAAAALSEVWRETRPGDIVNTVDVLDLAPNVYKQIYAEGYLKMVEHAPALYGRAFEFTDSCRLTEALAPVRRLFSSATGGRFLEYIQEFHPDILLSTHFLPLDLFEDLKNRMKSPLPFAACVVTDFLAHAFWILDSIDMYFVAARETADCLARRGVSRQKVQISGIPVRSRFTRRISRTATAARLGIKPRTPTLLVLGGGFGVGPILEIVDQLQRVQKPVQVLVVCGKNEELRRDLQNQAWKQQVTVFGYVDNMHELMAASDMIVTKAGGLTVSEALAIGRPLALIQPIPGQETGNAEFLVRKGAALLVENLEQLAGRISRLIGSPRIKKMAAASRRVGQPRAALMICKSVMRRWQQVN